MVTGVPTALPARVHICLTTLTSLISITPKAAPRAVLAVGWPWRWYMLALLGATLIDGTGAPVIPDSAVLLNGQQIAEIAAQFIYEIEAGASVRHSHVQNPRPRAGGNL